MDDQPIWLLDVDGPINAPNSGWSAAPFHATVAAQRDFKLRWSPDLIRRIRKVHARGQAEIWWCTTWCPWTDALENLWGLPRLPRALPAEVCRAGGQLCRTAKAAAARRVVESGRRLVWTDDEVTPTSGDLFDELTAGGRGLLIAPSSRRGLRPEDLDRIEAFCGPGTGAPIAVGDHTRRELALWVGDGDPVAA